MIEAIFINGMAMPGSGHDGAMPIFHSIEGIPYYNDSMKLRCDPGSAM